MIPFQDIIKETTRKIEDGSIILTEHAEERIEQRDIDLKPFHNFSQTLLGLCLNDREKNSYKSWHSSEEGKDVVVIYALKEEKVEVITAYDSDLQR